MGRLRKTFLPAPGITLLPLDTLKSRARACLRVTRKLRLVRFFGPDRARLGGTAEITHGGPPYDSAQAWSLALYRHPSAPDGIAYTARHDDQSVCCALFDRNPPCVDIAARDMDPDQDWLWETAEKYGVGLAPE